MKVSIKLLCYIVLLCSCNKKWLDIKADKSIVSVGTLKDYEAILNNTDVFNKGIEGAAALAEMGTDDYFVTTTDWQSLGEGWQQKAYIFDRDMFAGLTNVQAWNLPYQRIFYANVVLDGIDAKNYIAGVDQSIVEQLRGTALFFRANAFFQLALLFSKSYTAGNEPALGIPLKLSADINMPTVRASLSQTYQQILQDLKHASLLLPAKSDYKTRPTMQAAFGLLSRVYLSAADFDSSLYYANKCLALQNTLIDFSKLNASASFPVPANNEEVIFHEGTASSLLSPLYCRADTVFYASFANNDLRKKVFFYQQANVPVFKGNYTGSSELFSGIAVNEVLLNRAECYARKGDVSKGLADLNNLLHFHNKKDDTAYQTADAAQLLNWVLEERRKELCFRSIRWLDQKRLNKEPEHAITVKRIINDNVFILSPGAPGYVYKIPDDIITFTGIEQN